MKRILLLFFLIVISMLSEAQPSNFMVGRYIISDGSTALGPSLNTSTFKFSEIQLTVGASPEIRNFTVEILPGASSNGAQFIRSFTLDLSNGEIELLDINTGLSCSGVNIIFGPAASGGNTLYSVANGDASFDIGFTENTLNACSSASTQSSFILTKIPATDTFIPDDNFEQALISLGYDSVQDNLVTRSVIENIFTLDISASSIIDPTGIEAFTSLATLDISNNDVEQIDLSALSNLINLNLGNSQSLTSMQIPLNLEVLRMDNNSLSVLNLPLGSNLKEFFCNNCTDLYADLFPPSLETIEFTGTDQLFLDLSANPNLSFITLNNNNSLEYIDLSTSTNTSIISFSAIGNSNLACMLVGDVAFMQSNFPNSLNSGQSFVNDCNTATQTFIPDDNFEQELITQGFDNILDNFVTTSSIANITTLDIRDLNISNITGVEQMTQLTQLQAGLNLFQTIDLSNNTNLVSLNLIFNRLNSIDLSNNVMLETLDVSGGQFDSLDVTMLSNLKLLSIQSLPNVSTIDLSQNPLLETLIAAFTSLNNIDLSQNILLKNFSANPADPANSQLSNIDLLVNDQLETLRLSGIPMNGLFLGNKQRLSWLVLNSAQLTSIDVTANLNLRDIEIIDNPLLNSIDLTNSSQLESVTIIDTAISNIDFSNNTLLNYLFATSNRLRTLNLDNNPALTFIRVNNNQLTQLSINNGNNSLIVPNDPNDPSNQGLWSFNATNNNLACISVSDINYMNTNFLGNIDPSASFSLNCTASVVEEGFRFEIFPNPSSDYLNVSSQRIIDQILVHDMTGRKVEAIDVNDSEIRIPIHNWTSGNYLINAVGKDLQATTVFSKK
ncbi:putative secreted protein (Por secretion system target) [Nonlabens dokdonensis]|nr:T9SS type A sorting domain-containing protein [Nonlabens dokdonensis]PZX43894.1 putative secreted protein (Por secretion system target) [Nonlabens dokdonensis]